MKFILNCIVDDPMLDNQNQETHRLNYTSNTINSCIQISVGYLR